MKQSDIRSNIAHFSHAVKSDSEADTLTDTRALEAAQKGAAQKFAHLHLHTSYSLLDGAIRISDLMRHVKSLGMDSVAMTDHGNMFGAVEFYKAAQKEGIKPIIGCEFYVSPGGCQNKVNIEGLADGNNYHLVILAQNKTGYTNLLRLASRSYTEGFYRKPRIDYELLEKHSDGLVCLTACLGGEVQQKVITQRQREAAQLAGKLQEIFGKDRFYLEIQDHGLPEEQMAAKGNLEIARKNGIELCLTNDSHFLTKNDHTAQDILLRINQKKTINDPLFFSFNPEFYVKSPQEMASLFPELPQAFHNTNTIADMIELDFEFGNPLLPRFDIPEGESLDTYLYKLAYTGLEKRYRQISPEVKQRFDYEYQTITKMDFSGYFLIVQDFINFARSRDIPTGPGRGSAAGSIISYALGITDIDPLRYGLLFERFLNPDRKEMPDIDVDFCTERREEVIQYVRDKYGSDRVGQIITYGTMTAKACLKDVARVLNVSFEEANAASRMFPDVLGISIEDALSSSRELKEYAQKGDVQKKLFQVAKTLEGNVRHTGVHAAGIVISPEPLEELLPMATVANRSASRKRAAGRVLVSQYDMQALADVGLVKMDFLGLRNLTVIDDAIRGIEKRLGKQVHFDNTKMDDTKTFDLICQANLSGIFQLESSPGMRELVIRMKPNCFEDLIALIALFRPGPLQSGMADSYVNRKSGQEKLSYSHSDLEEVLSSTYGVILYQEQVMQISQKIGGLSPSQADSLRKAMGKKIHEKMEEMRKKFTEGALSQGYEHKFAVDLYEQMAQFASYGFNKSHSAAYACIVYQTAYLKANYPIDYMCALLNSEIEKTEGLIPYINACSVMDIRLLGPDINKSSLRFSVEEDKFIRFGLAGIKNVGTAAVESFLAVRKDLPNQVFTSFFHFMENIDLKLCNRRMIDSLNQAGAFLSFGYKRKTLQNMDVAFSHAQKMQNDRRSGQGSLFAQEDSSYLEMEPILKDPDAIEYSQEEVLRMEKDLLGFYLSGHPLAKYEAKLRSIRIPTIEDLSAMKSGKSVEVAAILSDFSIRLSRSGKEMCRLVLEDRTSICEAVILPAAFAKMNANLEKNKNGIVLLEAVLEKREGTGTVSLLVNSIQELNSELIAERQEKSLHIKLWPDNKASLSMINQIKTILATSRGSIDVYFHLLKQGKQGVAQVIKAHKSFSVQYSNDLCKRLASIHNVQSIYLSIGDEIKNTYNDSVSAKGA